MRKLPICTPRYILSISLYVLYIFNGCNFRTTQDVIFKFSVFLSFVEAIKPVEFLSAMRSGFKVGIFRISPIQNHRERTMPTQNIILT